MRQPTMIVSAPFLGSERWNLGRIPLRCQVARMRGMSFSGGSADGKMLSWWKSA